MYAPIFSAWLKVQALFQHMILDSKIWKAKKMIDIQASHRIGLVLESFTFYKVSISPTFYEQFFAIILAPKNCKFKCFSFIIFGTKILVKNAHEKWWWNWQKRRAAIKNILQLQIA